MKTTRRQQRDRRRKLLRYAYERLRARRAKLLKANAQLAGACKNVEQEYDELKRKHVRLTQEHRRLQAELEEVRQSIARQESIIRAQAEQAAKLQAEVALARGNSRNSSKPPSSDIIKPP